MKDPDNYIMVLTVMAPWLVVIFGSFAVAYCIERKRK